jgi:hypothetical protein
MTISKSKLRQGKGIRRAAYLLTLCVSLPGISPAQVGQGQPSPDAGAAERAKAAMIDKASEDKPESIYFVERVAEAGAVQAIPMLEKKFVQTSNTLDKAHVASALVRLGDKNDTYWAYLVKQATPVVESDEPDFMGFDAQGKSVAGPSPEFVAWAKAHDISPQTAGEDAVYLAPGMVGMLAMTGDPRGIPLLRRALASPNRMIAIMAANGLAEIQDKESIPLIIEACHKAPAESAALIAKSLVYFDDPQAQAAVDNYIPTDMAKLYREGRAGGERPFGQRPLHP